MGNSDGVSRKAPSGPGRRLFLGIGGLGLLSCAIVAGLVAWQSERERAETLKREKSGLARLAQVVSAETSDMFGRIRLLFEAADLWLSENPGADPRKDAGFVRLVAALGGPETARRPGGRVLVYVVSASGDLFLVPSSSPSPAAYVSDRAYFKAQSAPKTRGFYIGDPVVSRVTGEWTLPVSYPLSTASADIAILVATIELPDLEALYEAIRPKPQGSVALFRHRDGVLLARSPFLPDDAGKPLATPSLEAWKDAITASPSGTWIVDSELGGRGRRIVSYSLLPDLGLVVSIASKVDDVLAPWKAGAAWRIVIAAIMIAVVGYVSFRLIAALARLASAQAELRDNLERLRRSDATKNKLFSVIAHDLRGPIGGMCNLLETMATDRGDMPAATLDEFIGALRLTSWNTYQLLENLLAWSRSKRGEMPFSPHRILLQPLAEECAEVFALSVADKELVLDIDIEPGLEARADPELLKVVLRNLISNAVKFTRRGGRIRLSASRGERRAEIVVRDEGIGMDREQLDALFKLEATRSRSGTENERGSGLGLVLSEEIVELHGGTIRAESAADAGSSFTVTLPDEAPSA